MKSFLSSLLILNFCLDFYCELFTSSLKLCHLLHSELNQLRILEDTLGNDKKSANITMLLKDIREYVPISYFNKKEYDIDDCLFEESKMTRFITNPVNAYMIIQRFSKEWTDVQREISFSKERSKIILNKSFNLSGQGEIRGVREAFYRLGVFYHLEPNFLANGQLAPEWSHLTKDWTIVPKKMASNDLFEIGKIAFKHKDYDSTLGWMEQALKSLTSEQTPNYKELMFDILDYLSWSEYSVGLNQEAYLHCLRMIEIHPNNKRIQNNLIIFNKSRLSGNKVENKMKDYVIKTLQDKDSVCRIKKTLHNYKLNGGAYKEFEESLSQVLCKYGKTWQISPENLIGTKCYIKRGTDSSTKFEFANVEKIFTDPDVFILRGMVDNEQILHFKKLAREHLQTATVFNPATGMLETADYRITQSSWFNVDSDPLIRKMKKKLQVATGLTLHSSEDLQLANYGIGGYYDTHFDFAPKNEPSYRNRLTTLNGGRLATYLLYMSNVAIGGHTGFHRLGLSVSPSKGDALFWYNLLRDGTGDGRTRHIACPVVLGTKWVGNFWIRSRGEELSRPCDLVEQGGI